MCLVAGIAEVGCTRDMETHCDLLNGRARRGGVSVSRVHSRGDIRIAFFEGRVHSYTTAWVVRISFSRGHKKAMADGLAH